MHRLMKYFISTILIWFISWVTWWLYLDVHAFDSGVICCFYKYYNAFPPKCKKKRWFTLAWFNLLSTFIKTNIYIYRSFLSLSSFHYALFTALKWRNEKTDNIRPIATSNVWFRRLCSAFKRINISIKSDVILVAV